MSEANGVSKLDKIGEIACGKCGAPLCRLKGSSITIGGAVTISQRVDLRCVQCGHRTRWRPSENLDNSGHKT